MGKTMGKKKGKGNVKNMVKRIGKKIAAVLVPSEVQAVDIMLSKITYNLHKRHPITIDNIGQEDVHQQAWVFYLDARKFFPYAQDRTHFACVRYWLLNWFRLYFNQTKREVDLNEELSANWFKVDVSMLLRGIPFSLKKLIYKKVNNFPLTSTERSKFHRATPKLVRFWLAYYAQLLYSHAGESGP